MACNVLIVFFVSFHAWVFLKHFFFLFSPTKMACNVLSTRGYFSNKFFSPISPTKTMACDDSYCTVLFSLSFFFCVYYVIIGLLPSLARGALLSKRPSRVVVVPSTGHALGPATVHWDNLAGNFEFVNLRKTWFAVKCVGV